MKRKTRPAVAGRIVAETPGASVASRRHFYVKRLSG